MTTQERLLDNIAVMPDGCWLWTGQITKRGYGRISVHGKHRPAHRASYEAFVGPIPEGLVLDHFFCDERSCINPQHVRPCTDQENLARAGNWQAKKTHCKRGHEFTEDNMYRYGTSRSCRQCALDRSRISKATKSRTARAL